MSFGLVHILLIVELKFEDFLFQSNIYFCEVIQLVVFWLESFFEKVDLLGKPLHIHLLFLFPAQKYINTKFA